MLQLSQCFSRQVTIHVWVCWGSSGQQWQRAFTNSCNILIDGTLLYIHWELHPTLPPIQILVWSSSQVKERIAEQQKVGKQGLGTEDSTKIQYTIFLHIFLQLWKKMSVREFYAPPVLCCLPYLVFLFFSLLLSLHNFLLLVFNCNCCRQFKSEPA